MKNVLDLENCKRMTEKELLIKLNICKYCKGKATTITEYRDGTIELDLCEMCHGSGKYLEKIMDCDHHIMKTGIRNRKFCTTCRDYV